MTRKKLLIWTDFNWSRVSQRFRETTLAQYEFVQGADDLNKADIAFGKPDPAALTDAASLQWIHLSSAGHAEYGDDLKVLLQERGVKLTNSSQVYAEPCAEHLFAMMLSVARGLPQAMKSQLGAKDWNHTEQRKEAFLLKNQKVLLLGFGAIAQRLAQMLQPFDMQISALRRHPSDEPNVTIISQEELTKVLLKTDHIVDILPKSDSTNNFVDESFLAGVKPDAVFYNIGRGSTVNQKALVEALQEKRLRAAYLDVTTPEPLPPESPLWSAPNCYITPHSGGGHHIEFDHLLQHFLDNLQAFEKGEKLADSLI